MSSPFIEHNGRLYARATAILAPLSDFSAVPEPILRKKQEIGTDVHKAIHGDITDEMYIPNPESFDYYRSFLLWKEAIAPTFFQPEMRYFDDSKRVTGQIDALIHSSQGAPTLVDWKTSSQEQPVTWPMQAHIYYYLLTTSGQDVEKRFLFIKLDKYGGLPKVHEYPYSDATMDRCMRMIDSFWERHSYLSD